MLFSEEKKEEKSYVELATNKTDRWPFYFGANSQLTKA